MNNYIKKIKEENENLLLKYKNVVGVGTGKKFVAGKPTKFDSIIVFVKKKVPEEQLKSKDILPHKIQGVLVDVIESGIISALGVEVSTVANYIDRTSKLRPAPGGCSTGHFRITAGTLGAWIKDKTLGPLLLSNCHVIANSGDCTYGDNIYQPGCFHGGGPGDEIAYLFKHIEINFSGGNGFCPFSNFIINILNSFYAVIGRKTRFTTRASANLVDCALGHPFYVDDVDYDIIDIGTIKGENIAEIGEEIRKSGVTTEITENTVISDNTTVTVSYGKLGTAIFKEQLVAGNMCAGGDSGSCVLNNQDEIVGLLFAGSDKVTIINKIQNVFNALGLDIIYE